MHKDQCLILLLLFLFPCFSVAAENIQCATSCGNVTNISYPFRLRGDHKSCGNSNYELVCINNHTVLNLYSSKYYVRYIDYANYTIRIADAGLRKGNCSSLPLRSLSCSYFGHKRSWYSWEEHRFYGRDLSKIVSILNCSKAIASRFYIDASSCFDGSELSNFSTAKRRVYAMVDAKASYVETACTVELMAMMPGWLDGDDLRSYAQIHEQMFYGFELSWLQIAAKMHCKHRYGYGWRVGGEHQIHCGPKKENVIDIFIDIIIDIFILITLFVALKVILGAPWVMIFLVCKWKRRHLAMDQNIEEFLQSNNNFLPIRYSYSDIKKITGGLKEKLGEGGFGFVFKGRLRSDHEVAVKILKKGKMDGEDFMSEVATIGRIHHFNVVGLIGYCFESSKQILVYDLMKNGSLDKHIFSQGQGTSLDCKEVYRIAFGVAQGIEYLHRGCDMQILHFDIKPHNILLDKDFNPKISDFGLAKLYPTGYNTVSMTTARGTFGYMAPELVYRDLGSISHKADVYSFGKLLMEMASGRKNLDAEAEHSSQIYFPLWIHDQYNEGLDVPMEQVSEEDRRMVKKMIIIALWCIQLNPSNRPLMYKVMKMLEGGLEELQMPPRPLFYAPELSSREDEIRTSEGNDTSISSNSAITYENSQLENLSTSITEV